MSARQPARKAAGLWLGMILIVLAVLAPAVMRLPLGISEAGALAWLDRLVDAAGLSFEAFERSFAAAGEAGQPALSLALAAMVSQCVPALDALMAIRLPDALAALGLAGLIYRSAESSEAGFALGLWVVVFAVACIGWIAPMGLVLDQFAAILVFAGYRAHAGGASRWTVWLGLLIGSAALVANGAGIYAVAVVGGLWLHAGLFYRDWRLLGSYRFTAFGGVLVAGLTLTPALGLPRLIPFEVIYRQYAATLAYNGVPPRVLGCLAAWAVLVIPAMWTTVARVRGATRRYALIILLGCLILSMAGAAAPIGFVGLAPFVALWLTAPVFTNAVDGASPSRWLSGFYGLVFAAQALLLATWGVTSDAGLPAMPVPWAIAAVVVVLFFVAAAAAWRGRSSAAGLDALPIAIAILALAIALIGVLDQPRRLAPQRVFDRLLASDIQAFNAPPTAVLAPVSAELWRAELGRPVFTAANLRALCRWAARGLSEGRSGHEADRSSIALVRASTTKNVLAHFPSARVVLQSPGTPSSSVMVIDLGKASERACESRPGS